ncbi:MAG: alanine racemase [Lachnospiraceae bacterium]|nr:alanine racemase [Lachnospiraceae bacterium]
MKKEVLREAAERFGTPLYVFDLDALRSRVKMFRESLGPRTGLTYAMKTNPFVTRTMAQITDRIEVCSFGEFLICRDLKTAPEKLFISGVLKLEEDLEQILEYGRDQSRYTAESPQQFRQLAKWAADRGLTLRVYPRLTNGSQFGMDEDTIAALVRDRAKYPSVEIAGIHFFSGTQKRRLQKHAKELAALDAFFGRLKEECGFEVPELEYGTGFAVPYFEGKEQDMRTPETMQQFMDLVGAMQWKGKLTLEMGRAFAAECGSYVTTVRDCKENDGNRIALVDGGIHQINYDGQIKGMYRPHITVLPCGGEREQSDEIWGIYGSLCTMNDVLCKELPAGELRTGDRIVFEKTGAYSFYEGMSLFLSHEIPAAAVYSEEGGLVQIRKRRESYRLNIGEYEI